MVDHFKDRLRRLGLAADLGLLDALLVSHLPDIRWASGFTGSNACLLVAPSGNLLITDGRYKEQVRSECPALEALIVSGPLETAVAAVLKERGLQQVFLQKSHVSWEAVGRLRNALEGKVVVGARDPMPSLRATKSGDEVDAIRRALTMTEQVFEEVLPILKEGVTEQEVAAEIDYRHRLLGASGPAFDTIVAFSDHAALPHARPGKRALKRGDIVLMDFGGVVDGYHSDMTRTVAFGRTDKLFLETYEAVRSALLTSTEAACAGITGEELDGVARKELTMHGFGSAFSHSLGHGVGLEIHESPSVSSRNTNSLPAGCIITLEPGVYLPGEFGIRIENMVHLNAGGRTVLNVSSTDLIRL
jgi:Xaa-Pro aminopeptidase